MLRKAVCSDVQRLLLNTLPEPIVREIATGTSRIAHRYENVTVLQADMVGFTPLSAARGPEEVLGILSELFADFDQAAERWGVHKVKTIGDAYIVCCGAFVCTDDDQEAARRIVNMALSMQYIVSQKAFERGVDISVRIGVHTGMVIGGIIGTVRFHFDMWGNGVAGAVRLEELGAKGRVHLSDLTADLVNGHFALEKNIKEGDEAQKQLEEGFGIQATYLVMETQLNMSEYGLHHDSVTVATDYDFSEVLGNRDPTSEQDVLAIDKVLLNAKQNGGAGHAFGRGFLSLLSMPRMLVNRTTERRSTTLEGGRRSNLGGKGEVTNAIAFMKKLAGASEEDSSMFGEKSMFFGERSFGKRKSATEKEADGGSSNGPADTTPQRNPSGRKGSISLGRNFFVKKTGAHHTMSASSEEALQQKKVAEDNQMMLDAKRFLTHQTEVLLAVVVTFGLYDFLCGFGAALFVSTSEISSLLIVRYAALVPALMLARQFIATSGSKRDDGTPVGPSSGRVLMCTLSLIAIPTIAFITQIGVIGDEVRPCPLASTVPLCASADSMPPSAPPLPLPPAGHASSDEVDARVCALGGASAGYCRVGYNGDYVRTLGMLLIVCHYMLVYARLSTVMTTSFTCSALAISMVLIAQQNFVYNDALSVRHIAARWASSSALDLVALGGWWLLAHAVGVLHYTLRYINLSQARILKKRHYRLLASIREESEHCENLLKNILPPHVLVHLGGLLAHADHAAKGKLLPSKTIAERYTECSFLFAKIGGLSNLVNDDAVDPKDMMTVLQIMFDRFDALADMFGVQKLRKTANEYYLVAAGLPNQKILPSPEDRACGIAGFGFAMINIMNIINLELQQYGITFTCQVGIHSGSAIAGIIGHKTFQYDLCGDAVNTAARMCSYSKPNHINISEVTHELLKKRYGAVPRGELNIKGKGKMKTYFLLNMPVEQQEALAAIAAPPTLDAGIVQVVDRWAVLRKTRSTANLHSSSLASSGKPALKLGSEATAGGQPKSADRKVTQGELTA